MPSMLSFHAVVYLESLTYRDDADRLFCLLPLGGIYWQDEIPDVAQFETLSEDEQCMVWRLLAIRIRIWDGERLTDTDGEFWDRARRQIPNCPLFQRLELSPDDRWEQYQVEQATADLLKGFFAAADHITMREVQPGIRQVSVTTK